MGQIENYLADLENVEDLYHQNWVLPYGSAYARAHEQFRSTLDDQRRYDELVRDLFITAVTLGFGAGMGAMFGKTALRAVVADQALNFVCDRNMQRAFALMHRVQSSIPGTYIVEELWNAVSAQLSARARERVTALFATPSASALGMTNPQVLQNDMLAYVLRQKTAAHEVAADVRDNERLSQAQKDGYAIRLRNAEFFCNAPHRNLTPDQMTAANIIELSFYMAMVMNADYWVRTTTYYGDRGSHPEVERQRLGPITVPTSDPTYGVAPESGGFNTASWSRTTVAIAYEHLGRRVLERTNVLYRQFFNHDFITIPWIQTAWITHPHVQRAERAIEQLNRRILTTLPRR